MNCPSREYLLAFLRGDCDEVVSRHVEDCPTCEHALASLPDLRDSLQDGLRLAGRVEPFVDWGPLHSLKEDALETVASDSRRLGRYELQAPLGPESGQGVVYRARDTRTGRLCAVKLLRADRRGEKEVARLLREIEALRDRLKDPNIVLAFDGGMDADEPYLVMELLDGLPLDRLLRERGPLAADAVCAILAQTASALCAVHDAGWVHRDIKPANLFLTRDGKVKLLDLGLARGGSAPEELTMSSVAMGTPGYLSPEQATDAARAGIGADLYSLGCVGYRLLTDRLPHDVNPAGEPPRRDALVLAARTDSVVPLSSRRADVPAALVQVIHRLLERDPAKRFQSAEELIGALQSFQPHDRDLATLLPSRGEAPREAVLSPRDVPTTDFEGRSVRMWLLGALAMSVLALAVVGAWWLQRAPSTPANGEGLAAAPTNFQVWVWRAKGDKRHLSESLPLKTNDALQVRFRVPAGTHAGLFYVNGRGELRLLRLLEPAKMEVEAIYPGANETIDLKDPTGTELLFVCGRADWPVTEEEVRELWEAEPGWSALEPAGRLLRWRHGGVAEEGEKPRDLGEVRRRPEEAVCERLERVRARLRPAFPLLDGLAFRHD